MNYAKHVKKQQRKQLKAQRKMSMQRTSSAYGMRKGGSGKFLTGIVLLVSYIANASEVNALAGTLF